MTNNTHNNHSSPINHSPPEGESAKRGRSPKLRRWGGHARNILSRLTVPVTTLLVLLALYTTLGRLLMPLAANYAPQLEARAAEISGSPVTLANLQGTFRGFNPVLLIDHITIPVNDGPSLELRQIQITLHTFRSLIQARWVIDIHLQHRSRPLRLGLALRGLKDPATISGTVFIALPDSDYAEQANTFARLSETQFTTLQGAGDFWLYLRDGKLGAIAALPNISEAEFTLGDSAPLRLAHFNIAMQAFLVEGYTPNQLLYLRASHLDLGLITRLALTEGLLPESATADLRQYAPKGYLRNISAVFAPDPQIANSTLRANLDGVALSSVRGSPNLAGLDGYLELQHDSTAPQIWGRAELDSSRFRINIPNTFTREWQYDSARGAIDFHIDLQDGREVRLVSSPIAIESETLTGGKVQFTSIIKQPTDGEREAWLDLLVGVERLDIADRALYLPDGLTIKDQLRAAMAWLEQSIDGDGAVVNSGVVFRGSSLINAERLSKTFQSYFTLQSGDLQFSPDWPPLQDLQATLTTNDDRIDLHLNEAHSLGLPADGLQGSIRPDAEGNSHLQVQGQSAAPLATGLQYLQQAPLGDSLQEALGNWQAEGEFTASIEVQLPLADFVGTGPGPQIALHITLPDNSLTMPDYDLSLDPLQGELRYTTADGLNASPMPITLFDAPATISISSRLASSSASAPAIAEAPRRDRLQAVLLNIESDAALGHLSLPLQEEQPMQLNLQHLHLPEPDEDKDADESDTADAQDEDPLADFDPRRLPLMDLDIAQLKIGDKDYGSWALRLEPTEQGATISRLRFDFRGLRAGIDDRSTRTPQEPPRFLWQFDGSRHRSTLRGTLMAGNLADFLQANGYAASLNSRSARFDAELSWPGSPAFFATERLNGTLALDIDNGRFQQSGASTGPLKLISILNFDAIMRRLRFSDDLLRRGLAYDEIEGVLRLDNGLIHIEDRLVITGPSSLYQITGDVNLADETISGEMYITLPLSDNLPWAGLLTANLPLAVGAYLLDRIFGNQVDSLTSAVYTLEGPWDDLQPQFKQAFGSPEPDPHPH